MFIGGQIWIKPYATKLKCIILDEHDDISNDIFIPVNLKRSAWENLIRDNLLTLQSFLRAFSVMHDGGPKVALCTVPYVWAHFVCANRSLIMLISTEGIWTGMLNKAAETIRWAWAIFRSLVLRERRGRWMGRRAGESEGDNDEWDHSSEGLSIAIPLI